MLPGLPFLNWQPEVFLFYPSYEILLANATSNNFNCFFVRLKEMLCIFNICLQNMKITHLKKSLLLMKKSQEFQGFDSRPILITSYFFYL